jgi:transposase
MAKRQFTLTVEEIEEFKRAERDTQDVRELKRLQAVRLYGQGVTTQEIIEIVQCSDRRIRDWSHKYNQQGLDGLRSNWQGENALKLSRAQRAELKQRLQQYRPDEVMASDIRVSQGQFWTVSDLQIIIKIWYDISYKAVGSYRQLLHDCGFSYQRTESVYRSQPNPQAVVDFEAHLEKK